MRFFLLSLLCAIILLYGCARNNYPIPKTTDIEAMRHAIRSILAGQTWTPADVDLTGPADKETAGSESSPTSQPSDVIMSMMSKFMGACVSQAWPAGAPNAPPPKPGANPAPSEGGGCG